MLVVTEADGASSGMLKKGRKKKAKRPIWSLTQTLSRKKNQDGSQGQGSTSSSSRKDESNRGPINYTGSIAARRATMLSVASARSTRSARSRRSYAASIVEETIGLDFLPPPPLPGPPVDGGENIMRNDSLGLEIYSPSPPPGPPPVASMFDLPPPPPPLDDARSVEGMEPHHSARKASAMTTKTEALIEEQLRQMERNEPGFRTGSTVPLPTDIAPSQPSSMYSFSRVSQTQTKYRASRASRFNTRGSRASQLRNTRPTLMKNRNSTASNRGSAIMKEENVATATLDDVDDTEINKLTRATQMAPAELLVTDTKERQSYAESETRFSLSLNRKASQQKLNPLDGRMRDFDVYRKGPNVMNNAGARRKKKKNKNQNPNQNPW